MKKLSEKKRRLLIVSNRLPFTITKENGGYAFNKSSGGLVTGLSSFLESWDGDYIWIGWPGQTPIEENAAVLRKEALKKYGAYPIFLPEETMESFYQGFCNCTIWPLFHYFPSLATYSEEQWHTYRKVNELFAEAVLEIAEPNDIVWIHDYHLMLLPGILREKSPPLTIGFFLHIPFPSFEIFRLIPRPWATEIIDKMIGADLIGFHTHEYTQYFLRNVLRFTGNEHNLGQIITPSRTVKADTFPMGIEFAKFFEASKDQAVQKERDELQKTLPAPKVVFSVDRLDYTKGILNRLEGYQLFLDNNAEWRGKVIFLIVVVPSRIGVEHYQQMKNSIDGLVGKINGQFGDMTWTPIVYQYRSLDFPVLAALYSLSHIALITPLRDGMNLVAKEYVASRVDRSGVLILSEMAGASKELGEAIIINPNHKEDIARALEEAIEMPPEEQTARIGQMQSRLKTYDVIRWAGDFLGALNSIKELQRSFEARMINSQIMESMSNEFHRTQKRLLLLDYDGTLVPFSSHPAYSRPDPALIELLTKLSDDSQNDVVIISGRDKNAIGEWFHDIPLGLVAEHGAWIKERGEPWRLLRPINSDWKKSLYPILKIFADRLPGSFIEEKEFSLVWHYRRADPEHASLRAHELIDQLTNFTANIDIQILRGSKVVEIRNAGINKANAAMALLSRQSYDFILALGDDWTDEDLFKSLPPNAYTIKVGNLQSYARFNLSDYRESRNLLGKLLK